jgi:hypothetical protein
MRSWIGNELLNSISEYERSRLALAKPIPDDPVQRTGEKHAYADGPVVPGIIAAT